MEDNNEYGYKSDSECCKSEYNHVYVDWLGCVCCAVCGNIIYDGMSADQWLEAAGVSIVHINRRNNNE